MNEEKAVLHALVAGLVSKVTTMPLGSENETATTEHTQLRKWTLTDRMFVTFERVHDDGTMVIAIHIQPEGKSE